MFHIKYTGFVLLTLMLLVSSNDFGDLSTLGQRISDSVNRNLAPLHNLGERIQAQVKSRLEGARQWFGPHISQSPHFTGFNGDEFSQRLEVQLAPLNNLGQQIEQQVYESLEPVRAMEIYFKMKDGVGGTTIITHYPGRRQFIANNYQIYECSGSISPNGQCSGQLSPFKINQNSDFCYYKRSVSISNDHICIGSNSVTVINNIVNCENSNGEPVLSMSLNEYNQMCKRLSATIQYKYIANLEDPAHIQIPNKNKYIKCDNIEPDVCIFQESSTRASSYRKSDVYGNSQMLIINN